MSRSRFPRLATMAGLAPLLLAACVALPAAGGGGGGDSSGSVAGGSRTGGSGTGGGGAPATTGDAVADAFVARADAHRRALGCAPVVIDAAASAVAAAHSADMARRGYFSHTTPEGQGPFDRLRAAGIGYRAAAENIAFGQSTGDAVFDAWLRSAGHRRNLENCTYTHHGVGRSGTHWTHVLYRP